MLEHFNFNHKGSHFAILLIIAFSFFNLKCKTDASQWSEVNIDPQISLDSVYKQLDKQKEIFSVFEPRDSLMKRSSDVSYFVGELKDDKYSKLNNCRAYFSGDTLSIDIGRGNGFGGNGFVIYYTDKKFSTVPYHFTDVVVEREIEPRYKIVYQNLTLGKSSYKAADSLYGRIEFKSIETDNENKKTEHFATGNFRAKIRDR